MLRSWLLVPPLDMNQVATALSFHPDALVIDLVELVSEGRKPLARRMARETIEKAVLEAQVFAQVDKTSLDLDLQAVVWPGLKGLVVSRLESPEDVETCDQKLIWLERARGLEPNGLQMVASLDTALGNYRAMEVAAASKRLRYITLGRADLEMDLRPEPSGEIHLMPYLMQRLVIVAKVANLIPLGAWWRSPARGLLAGPEETRQAAIRGRALGFKGSLCIRGEQVEALNKAYG